MIVFSSFLGGILFKSSFCFLDYMKKCPLCGRINIGDADIGCIGCDPLIREAK